MLYSTFLLDTTFKYMYMYMYIVHAVMHVLYMYMYIIYIDYNILVSFPLATFEIHSHPFGQLQVSLV